ncbi:MAG: hypothetical protein E7641_03760 [Ruminococcaceae bacterium]|nr:hypothetical protein [Oscillospiraceae bacterium]
MLNEKAKWIWISPTFSQNEYVAFEGSYEYSRGKAILRIAAETDYILYVNHRLVSFGQFAGYPFEKYYDEIDLSEFSREGSNTLTVTVRYEGVNSATHIDDGGGLIFSLEIDGELALVSDENILCGYDGRYIAGQTRLITPQLGLTSGMKSGTYKADRQSVEVKKTRNIKKRPVKKTVLGDFIEAQPISEGSRIYDLGREEAGYLKIKLRSPSQASVKVVYGEHLADKEVRYLIGKRDFSVDIEADSGEEEFILLFLRIAARYLQVYAPDKTEILSIGLLPSRYPLTEKPFALTGLDKEIYDTSIRTLRLCMNTHYEDCPWREQALYVLDSRNQMLCGYYAFEETEFQRENLKFIAKGTREDGFLELTYPAVNTPAIPLTSFSAL